MSTVVATSEVHAPLDDLTTFQGRQDPYPTYAALRRLAPIARAADRVLVLSRYADCFALPRRPLARLEAQVAFPALFTRFSTIALAGPAERRNSLTLRVYLHLTIAFD